MRGIVVALALLAGCSAGQVMDPGADAAADGVVDAAPAAEQVRGVWITRFAYSTQAGLEGIIDRAAAAGFNAVFVQIRGEGDAYYHSSLEPWAERLTGTLGRDPGWDPLQVAIDRAHAHGMQLHAYFNVFSAWRASGTVPTAEGPVQHALHDHPEWMAVDSSGTNRDGEYRWFSPGNPAVRAHIAAVARDLLAHYDVDGLHLDRIRTPGPDYSRDAVTMAAFENADGTWGDFMRAQVSTMVTELYAVVHEMRPTARLSASVWGIYQPLPGCNTSQGYGNYYQDSLGWLDAGAIDAIVPMMYWPIEPGACTDWAELLDGFLARDPHIWAGMHALEPASGGGREWDFAEIQARLDYAEAHGAPGVVVFASTYLDEDPARWDAFASYF